MSERERWIVYPLLFLALGAALRDKLFDRTTSKSIVCQELTVIDEQPLGREPILLAKIGRTERTASGAPTGGIMILNGQLLVDGAINAKHYAYQGIPLLPALQALPGVSLPDLWKAMEHARREKKGEVAPSPQPPLAEPPDNK